MKRFLLAVVLVILLGVPVLARAQGATPLLAVRANREVLVRNAPDKKAEVVGSLPMDEVIKITGCDADCSWLEVGPSVWIRASQVVPVIAILLPDGTMSVRSPASAVETTMPQGAASATPTATEVPTATSLPVATIAPSPTAIATAANVPTQSEITTVGQWVVASEEQKRASALLWSQRLASANKIALSPEVYANELFDCVDITLGGSVEPFGESYSILDVAAVCAALMEQSAQPEISTPVPTALP